VSIHHKCEPDVGGSIRGTTTCRLSGCHEKKGQLGANREKAVDSYGVPVGKGTTQNRVFDGALP
jgi:hypothetical protein